MDAAQFIETVKERLRKLADDPPYVYRDTPQALLDAEWARVTTFQGFSEDEVRSAEQRLGVRFPTVFRTYLREIAKSPVILAADETDSPVFGYVEGDESPQQTAPSFAALLEAELKGMAEANALCAASAASIERCMLTESCRKCTPHLRAVIGR